MKWPALTTLVAHLRLVHHLTCLRSFYPVMNNLYHVMVKNPILLHPDYNSSVTVSGISSRLSLQMHIFLWISRTSVIVVLVLNQLVFHLLVLMIWGFVFPTPVYDVMLVMSPLWSLMLGLRSLIMCHLCQRVRGSP